MGKLLCTQLVLYSENDPVGLWLHRSKADSADAVEGERFSVHKNGSLEIQNLMKEDMGEYSCFAQNTEGKVAIAATLEVKGKRNRYSCKSIKFKGFTRFKNQSNEFNPYNPK